MSLFVIVFESRWGMNEYGIQGVFDSRSQAQAVIDHECSSDEDLSQSEFTIVGCVMNDSAYQSV